MKEFLKIYLPIFLLIGATFYISAQFISPAPTKVLTIATGRDTGSYFEYAQRYKKLLEAEDIEVKIIQSAGSLETLELLKNKKADIGFVQGGTVKEDDSKVLESIASIYFEPLWLFTKKTQKPINYLKELTSLTISIGEVGSGTTALVSQIFKANNLNINQKNIKNLNLNDSYKALKDGNIDLFFSVISADSPIILKLLEDKSIQSISLKRVKAYEKNFSYLKGITIHEGSIDLVKNLPSSDISLLATTASLAVRKDVDDALVRLFAKVIKKENHRNDSFPSINYLELPINQQAKQYLLHGDSILEKIFPYWIASNIDRLKIMLIPLLTLLIPIFKGFMPLYRWRIRSKIYKWYKKLDHHEQNFETYNEKELQDAIKSLKHLQSEIKEHTDVPLAYMNEYYMLKTHIDFVLKNIMKK